MTKEFPNDGSSGGPIFDLEERTAVFGEAVIGFARKIPRNAVTGPLISQFVRAREPAWERTTVKLMMQFQKKTSKTKSEHAVKNPGKQSCGCE